MARLNPGIFVGYGLLKTIYRIYDFVTTNFHECSLVSFCEDLKAWPLFKNKSVTEGQDLFDGFYKLPKEDIPDTLLSHENNSSACLITDAHSVNSTSHTPLRGIEFFC